tara:strand:+ start:232 stop:735 length:504 start_codon:yes stop_codon:yes gene_type:complete
MNNNCVKCDATMPDERVHLGYRECVECSSIEPYSAHVVYPHKTGAFVQPVSSETKKNLDRLDRRAVKVGGKINAPKAREWKDVVPQPKPKPKPQPKVFYNHQTFSDCFTGCKDTYIKYGYSKTVNHIKKLYKDNKINLMTRTELISFLTSIHVMNRKERKRALNAFV